MIRISRFVAAAIGVAALIGAFGAEAAEKVVVAYQTDALPSSLGIANGEFDKAAGAKIDFRRVNSGAEIFAAIASGDVQVGYVGSSPFATAVSRGPRHEGVLPRLDLRRRSARLPQRLGHQFARRPQGQEARRAPVSTDHYQPLALIKSLGLTEKDVQVFAIPQPDIVAGYNCGDLDGGFAWNPALDELKKNGKVLITSKEVAEKGAPTFSAWVATADFAKAHPDSLKAFAGVVAKYQNSFVADPAKWGRTAITPRPWPLLGGSAADQANGL